MTSGHCGESARASDVVKNLAIALNSWLQLPINAEVVHVKFCAKAETALVRFPDKSGVTLDWERFSWYIIRL